MGNTSATGDVECGVWRSQKPITLATTFQRSTCQEKPPLLTMTSQDSSTVVKAGSVHERDTGPRFPLADMRNRSLMKEGR